MNDVYPVHFFLSFLMHIYTWRWLLTCASVRSLTFISSSTDFGVAPAGSQRMGGRAAAEGTDRARKQKRPLVNSAQIINLLFRREWGYDAKHAYRIICRRAFI
jgi:hypothetical protein